jgi:hypothetical protein
MARLQTALPQVFTLGPYKPTERTGPACGCAASSIAHCQRFTSLMAWCRSSTCPEYPRQALRAGEECPRELQPLVELLYRGRPWHQRNGRDWTVDAFLVSEDGLGLDVAQDARTREAALRGLALLAETPLDGLRGHRLEADDFDRLAVSDPTRDLLRWMGIGDAFRTAEGEARWKAFCGVCTSEFKLDPDKKSPGDAASALVEGTGKWASVWQRFKEAPKLYPGVAQLLRELPGQLRLGFDPERSPRNNDEAEQKLRKDLEAVAQLPHAAALAKVLALETEHGRRRDWVWAQLGESPLAVALEPLARVAAAASTTLGGATIDAAISGYAADGWRCDRAALEAMSSVKAPADITLVGNAVRALYLPWLDASARHFQSLVQGAESSARAMVTGAEHEKDSCLLFADGLRYDVAGMLRDRLEAKGLRTRLGHRMAPLPTVTATAKPFSTLAHDALEGGEDIGRLQPALQAAHRPPRRSGCATTWRDEARPSRRGDPAGEAGRDGRMGGDRPPRRAGAQAGLAPRRASGDRARDAGRSDHRAARVRLDADSRRDGPRLAARSWWPSAHRAAVASRGNEVVTLRHGEGRREAQCPDSQLALERPRAHRVAPRRRKLRPEHRVFPRRREPAGVRRPRTHRGARRRVDERDDRLCLVARDALPDRRHDERPVRARRPSPQLEAGDDEHRGVGEGGRARRRSEHRCCR